jgi:hypothetical protein
MRIRPRLSIRLTSLLIALVAIVLAVVHWNDPAVRYRRDHDEVSLNAVMSHRVSFGDSVETIESLLGPGKPMTDAKFRSSVSKFVARMPSGYPQGLNPEDGFLGFSIGKNLTVLQFRNGRLINFKRSDFDNPSATFAGASK